MPSSFTCPIVNKIVTKDCPNTNCLWHNPTSPFSCIRSTANPKWEEFAKFKGLSAEEEKKAEAVKKVTDFIIFLRYLEETDPHVFIDTPTLRRISVTTRVLKENSELAKALAYRIKSLLSKKQWLEFTSKYNLNSSQEYLLEVLGISKKEFHELRQEIKDAQ